MRELETSLSLLTKEITMSINFYKELEVMYKKLINNHKQHIDLLNKRIEELEEENDELWAKNYSLRWPKEK